VLGLGNIGPRAAMPVMEGKCMLFKEFGGVDAFPICLDTQDVDEIVKTVAFLAPTFGGINLEDISSPRCVEIEQRLIAQLDIPVFHDDQHGTAVVVSAALQNALKVVEKRLDDVRVAILGAGAAGAAIAKLLISMGCGQIVLCDRKGAISRQRASEGNPDLVSVEDIKLMASDPVVFALANPDPEIEPEAAMSCARVVATGRSDYPNQINNVLCFPGLFRGMLDVRALRVTEAMKIAAARAIADIIPGDHIRPDYIIPSVFDKRVAVDVARAVANAAIEGGVAAENKGRMP
jgi:malate dehydrogenase (oxaloacetate-decarboxylating)